MHSLAQRVGITNMLLAREIEEEFQKLERIIRAERDERAKLETALRGKDEAMGTLFDAATSAVHRQAQASARVDVRSVRVGDWA